MSKRPVFVVKAPLDPAIRRLLLRTFQPRLSNVWLHHLTLKYGVGQDYQFPQHEMECVIMGRHSTDQHEALVCRLDDLRYQPASTVRLHLTLSTADGVPPAMAKEIDDRNIMPVDEVSFQVRLKLMPAWQDRPQPLETVFA